MGCLNVGIQGIMPFVPVIGRKGGCAVDTSLERDFNAAVTRDDLCTMAVSLICKVGTDTYIRVTPTEPLWITVGQDLTYTVHSNTDWVVL